MARGKQRWRVSIDGVQRDPRLLFLWIAILVLAIFVVDYLQPNIIALASLYAIPILISLWLGQRRWTVALALVCCALAIVGLHGGGAGDPNNPWMITANRAAAIFTIAVVTSLGLWRLRIERQLLDTREAVTTTLKSIADAVITVDTHGSVTFMNPVAEELTGVAQAEAAGKELQQVFRVVDEHPARAAFEELEARGPYAPFEGTLIARGGRRIPIQEKRAPIRDADGQIYGHVLVFRDITEQKEHEETMRRMAFRDELTGLPNRLSLSDRLSLELAHARRNREMLGVCYLDLDRFKEVNDSLGHHAGDEYLKAVAERLRAALRGGDTVARMGGDEFVLLLPGIHGVKDAERVARKVLGALCAPLSLEGREIAAGASLGFALYPRDGEEPETLLRRADKAMYRAKARGGSHFEFASGARGTPQGEHA